MSDQLRFEVALNLARRLKGIPGFPWDEENISATAEDLVSWCTGAFINGQAWDAETQADWLVKEVRNCWTQKWLGPGAMLRIFQNRFDIAKLGPERQPLDSRQWEKEYGPPDPAWSRNLLTAGGNKGKDHLAALGDMRVQAIRDSLYYTEGSGRLEILGASKEKRISQGFWQAAMDHCLKEHGREVAAIRALIAAGKLSDSPPVPEVGTEASLQVRLLMAAIVDEEVASA